MLFKNSVRTSKRTPHFTITKINWLMLFKEIIAVYTEKHIKSVRKLSVTDCSRRRYIQLPLGLKGLYEHREPWWNDIDNGKYDSST
jgi:hypothetical protein